MAGRQLCMSKQGLTGKLQEDDASAVAVKQVWGAQLPGEGGEQRCEGGEGHSGEVAGQHQILWRAAQAQADDQ